MKSAKIIETLRTENPDQWIKMVENGTYTPSQLKKLIALYKDIPNHRELTFSMLYNWRVYGKICDEVDFEKLKSFFSLILEGVD